MRFFRASVLVFFMWLASSDGEHSLEVQTKSGKVMGLRQQTVVGKEVDAFLGIPYAAPATGQNRFAPPKEADHWDGVLDATNPPRPCYQVVSEVFRVPEFAEFISTLGETEDCLKLNVWAPTVRTKRTAVMVWIHGGGFSSGSSDLAMYNGAEIVAQEDVIVVSMNYRLSGLGFLYLDHPTAPGNVGLMDQALAMKWVKKNIAAFGGDPEKITIFGESAGGASVGLQLVTPTSVDLFTNAILQSGTGNNYWATYRPDEALAQSLTLADQLGCPTQQDKIEATLRCLQSVPIKKLHAEMVAMENRMLKMSFKPVVDGKYLPRHPSELLAEGKFCGEKNVLLGYTKEDAAFIIPISLPKLQLHDDTVFTEDQTSSLISGNVNNAGKISGLQLELVKYVYTDWEMYPGDPVSARTQLINCLTDRWFTCDTNQMAENLYHKGNTVFLYRFDHIMNKTGMPFNLPQWMGSVHADELGFVFGHKIAKGSDSVDHKLAKQVMRYWANFARNSDPSDDYLPDWPRYTSEEKYILHIDGKAISVGQVGRHKECTFWKNIFSKTESFETNDV